MLVREKRRGGTRGSWYAYVLIGNELVHVSEVSKLIKHEDDEYIYELPSNVSPWIYIFSFSRSGYGFVTKAYPKETNKNISTNTKKDSALEIRTQLNS